MVELHKQIVHYVDKVVAGSELFDAAVDTHGPRTGRRATRVCLFALFLLLLILFIIRGPVAALGNDHSSVDFAPIYGGARAWMHGGDPYDIRTVHAEFYAGGGREIRIPNNYFPPFLPIAAIVARAPWESARRIWLAVSLLAWAAAVYGMMKMANWRRPYLLLPGIWGLAAWPAVMSIKMGQPAMLCCALTIWAMWFALKNRFLAGGIALGLAVGCKPTVAMAAVLFCLLQKKFKTLLIGGLVLSFAYVTVLMTAWPGSLRWLGEQRTNAFAEFKGGVSSPLPSGIEIADFVNLQPVVAMFTENLTLGNVIVFAVVACVVVIFFLKSQASRLEESWPAALTLSVSLTLAGVYHRYPDMFLVIAIVPVCYGLYTQGRYRLMGIVAGVLAILSIPLQTEFQTRLNLTTALGSHESLEFVRVLLLFHHQALLLFTLALLSFKMLGPNPDSRFAIRYQVKALSRYGRAFRNDRRTTTNVMAP